MWVLLMLLFLGQEAPPPESNEIQWAEWAERVVVEQQIEQQVEEQFLQVEQALEDLEDLEAADED